MVYSNESGWSQTSEGRHTHLCMVCGGTWEHQCDDCDVTPGGKGQEATCPICQD